jgi:DNA-binding IclR family transcriptional regulator
MALSMSGPTTRMTDETIREAVPVLRRAADRIAAEINGHGATRI